jgi:hypothetical protein
MIWLGRDGHSQDGSFIQLFKTAEQYWSQKLLGGLSRPQSGIESIGTIYSMV